MATNSIMFKPLRLFSILILLSCSGKVETGSEWDPSIYQIFNEEEIEGLNKIVAFFESQICGNDKISQKECYNVFFDRLMEDVDANSNLVVTIDFSEQKAFYQRLKADTFNEIWGFGKMKTATSDETFRYLQFAKEGKYISFLKEFAKKHAFIEDYHEAFINSGGLSPSIIANTLYNGPQYDIEDKNIRLSIAIHYLTLNDQGTRMELY